MKNADSILRQAPRRAWLRMGVAVAAAACLPGCARYYYGAAAPSAGGSGVMGALGIGSPAESLLEANQAAADALLRQVPQLDPRQPVLVATLVHIDRLGEASRLGRLFPSRSPGEWCSAACG